MFSHLHNIKVKYLQKGIQNAFLPYIIKAGVFFTLCLLVENKEGRNNLSIENLMQRFPICHSVRQGNINVQVVSSFHILLMYWKVFRTLCFSSCLRTWSARALPQVEQYGLLLEKPCGLIIVRLCYVLTVDTSMLVLCRVVPETRGLNKQKGHQSPFIYHAILTETLIHTLLLVNFTHFF